MVQRPHGGAGLEVEGKRIKEHLQYMEKDHGNREKARRIARLECDKNAIKYQCTEQLGSRIKQPKPLLADFKDVTLVMLMKAPSISSAGRVTVSSLLKFKEKVYIIKFQRQRLTSVNFYFEKITSRTNLRLGVSRFFRAKVSKGT